MGNEEQKQNKEKTKSVSKFHQVGYMTCMTENPHKHRNRKCSKNEIVK